MLLHQVSPSASTGISCRHVPYFDPSSLESIMPTGIEDLPVELCLEVFTYLDVRYQFQAFARLNTRLDRILLSHRHTIKWRDNNEDSQLLLEHVLHLPAVRENIVNVWLENTKTVSSSVLAASVQSTDGSNLDQLGQLCSTVLFSSLDDPSTSSHRCLAGFLESIHTECQWT